MKRRYIIGVDSLSEELNAQFRVFLEHERGYWWNWVPGLWLHVGAESHAKTGDDIRIFLKSLRPRPQRIFVMEVFNDDQIMWATMPARDHGMMDWINGVWRGEDFPAGSPASADPPP